MWTSLSLHVQAEKQERNEKYSWERLIGNSRFTSCQTDGSWMDRKLDKLYRLFSFLLASKKLVSFHSSLQGFTQTNPSFRFPHYLPFVLFVLNHLSSKVNCHM